MAELTVDGLGELTSPAANDEIGIWDVSAGQYLKIRRDTLVGGTITGGGTVATGGFTLTVPATGTAALLGAANQFTAGQKIGPAVDAVGLEIDTISSAVAYQLSLKYDSIQRFYAVMNATASRCLLADADLGSGNPAPNFQVGRNSNANASPGFVRFVEADGGDNSLYFDNSGILRKLLDQPPLYSNFASGDVIGAQTSHEAYKTIVGPAVPDAEALDFICTAAAQVRRFVYLSGAYGQEFSGLVLSGSDLDRYGQDADAEHAAGKSLNVINAVGDLFLAVRYLADRVNVLESAK